jgi:hypothetical protein
VGQFRMLNQWDVSRRLTLSEPLAFSAGVGGRSSSNTRSAFLRSFFLAGRAPAVRATFQTFSGGSESDGSFHELVLPVSGELTLPLGAEARRTASFEIEGRPKDCSGLPCSALPGLKWIVWLGLASFTTESN